jgi:hypothetical protein
MGIKEKICEAAGISVRTLEGLVPILVYEVLGIDQHTWRSLVSRNTWVERRKGAQPC